MTKPKETNVPEVKKLELSAEAYLSGPKMTRGQYDDAVLKIPGKLLHAIGLWPNDKVKIETVGEKLVITQILHTPPLKFSVQNQKTGIMGELMELTRQREERERALRAGMCEVDGGKL